MSFFHFFKISTREKNSSTVILTSTEEKKRRRRRESQREEEEAALPVFTVDQLFNHHTDEADALKVSLK